MAATRRMDLPVELDCALYDVDGGDGCPEGQAKACDGTSCGPCFRMELSTNSSPRLSLMAETASLRAAASERSPVCR